MPRISRSQNEGEPKREGLPWGSLFYLFIGPPHNERKRAVKIFKLLNIKQQLFALCSIALIALLFLISTTVIQLLSIKKELVNVVEEDIPLTSMVTDITLKQLEQSIEFERMLHYGVLIHLSDEERENAKKKYEKAIDRFTDLSKKVNKVFADTEKFILIVEEHSVNAVDKAKLHKFSEQLIELDESHKLYETHVSEVLVLLDERQLHNAEVMAESVEHEEDKLNQILEGLLKELEAFTFAAGMRAEHHEQTAIEQVFIIGCISTILILIVGFFISRSITRKILAARQVIGDISQNLDLTLRVDTSGRSEIAALGKDLNALLSTLSDCISSVVTSSTQLAAASEELSVISTQNTVAVSQQYSETDQVATAIDELSSTAANVAKVTSVASRMVSDADDAICEGTKIVTDNLAAMRKLEETVTSTNIVVEELHSHSTGISSALDTIQSVAEQTNLLALNAAIEAARAGEAGRGFAVVADEVRDLASRTQGLTDQIRDLVANLQKGSHDATQMMGQSRENTSQVLGMANKTEQALEKIAVAVSAMTDFNCQISSAAEQQSSVTLEISKNVSSIRNIAQENSETTRQTTTASEELSHLAADLHQSSRHFKIS